MSVTVNTTPIQTLPYGDRPFVELEGGHLVTEAYQYLQRLRGGVVGTIQNVGTLVQATNTIISNVTSLSTQVDVIEQAFTQLVQQINMAAPANDQSPPAAPQQRGVILEQAFGLAFFFG